MRVSSPRIRPALWNYGKRPLCRWKNHSPPNGKGQAFPTGRQTAFPQRRPAWPFAHSPTAPTTANIHPFFPTWIKENKSIKNGEYSYHHTSGNCTPFLCLEKWRKSTLFPIILPRREAEDKSYCLCILSLAELIKSSVFNLFPASFLPYLSGREDRQQFQPGNSACSYGYIFCRSCCTAACRSPQERSSIPVSTFYFGS